MSLISSWEQESKDPVDVKTAGRRAFWVTIFWYNVVLLAFALFLWLCGLALDVPAVATAGPGWHVPVDNSLPFDDSLGHLLICICLFGNMLCPAGWGIAGFMYHMARAKAKHRNLVSGHWDSKSLTGW